MIAESPVALARPLALFGAYPRAVALALGAMAACGFQPLALWPLMLAAIAGLIALVAQAADRKRAALLGWLWGLAQFTAGDNWIATAFTHQAKMPASLGWAAVVLLASYLALFPAVAALGAWHFRQQAIARVLGFAGCWILGEWLRAWLFTGFAWNPVGLVLLGDFAHPGLAGVVRWTGTYGLSGLAVLVAGLIGEAVRALHRPPSRAAGLMILAAASMPPGAAMMFGSAGAPEQGTIPYTLVQPDIAQDDLDDPAHFEDQFVRTARLTLAGQTEQGRLVLWPESGVPDYLREGYPLWAYRDTFAGDPALSRARIARVIGEHSLLLTGTTDLEVRGDNVVGARNVVTALDGTGAIRGSYAKAHLVPYGEYLPMRWLLKPLGLARLVPGDMDFSPGPGPRTLDLGPWGKAGIQICYEIVFSGEVVDRAHRPDYIFNPSNDGWFGSWGPPQHLAQARLRAIEEGLPILRSTTNGISAVIDADGVVRQFAPRGVAAALHGLIPPAHAPTLFARTGNMLALGGALILLALAVVATRRRRR